MAFATYQSMRANGASWAGTSPYHINEVSIWWIADHDLEIPHIFCAVKKRWVNASWVLLAVLTRTKPIMAILWWCMPLEILLETCDSTEYLPWKIIHHNCCMRFFTCIYFWQSNIMLMIFSGSIYTFLTLRRFPYCSNTLVTVFQWIWIWYFYCYMLFLSITS